jgi:hypothetical protein
VADTFAAAGRRPGELDVVLVGGTHPDPGALADAGAAWCVVEVMPGATAADARRLAAR